MRLLFWAFLARKLHPRARVPGISMLLVLCPASSISRPRAHPISLVFHAIRCRPRFFLHHPFFPVLLQLQHTNFTVVCGVYFDGFFFTSVEPTPHEFAFCLSLRFQALGRHCFRQVYFLQCCKPPSPFRAQQLAVTRLLWLLPCGIHAPWLVPSRILHSFQVHLLAVVLLIWQLCC